ncbi:MAG: hypothetical protein JWM33_3316 [Caulobacteraceae bacterium]|nr:hypothetical protein [Caulobacteraceae bacterium]
MPKQVLFLDIDGVLNNVEDQRRGWRVDPAKVVLLNELECEIVITSTLRMEHSVAALGALLQLSGLRRAVIGATPYGRKMSGQIILGQTRGTEIAQWLAANPRVRNYAIVDDEGGFTADQIPRLVQTYFSIGLTPTHVQLLAAIFKRGPAAQEPSHARS